MGDISAFLLARYGEIAAQTRRAADARARARQTSGKYAAITGPILDDERLTAGRVDDRIGASAEISYWDFDRVLADLDAKRQRLRLHRGDVPTDGDRGGSGLCCEHDRQPWPCLDLRLDALPFADHPDYQQHWRPASRPLYNQPSESAGG